MTVTTEDILQHHGVKGMKWGVRKKSERKTREQRRETHASKLDVKAGEYRSKIKSLEAKSVDGKLKNYIQNRKIRNLSKKEVQAIKDSIAKREGKLTRREKQIVVGAAVVAVAATYVIGAKAQSGELNRLAMKGQAYLKKEMPSFKTNESLSRKFDDPDELFKSVVHGMNDPSKIGGASNCRRSTLSYELRRRGKDVVPTRTTTGSGQTHGGLYNMQTKNGEPYVGNMVSMMKTAVKETIAKEKDPNVRTPFIDFAGPNSVLRKNNMLGENEIGTGWTSFSTFKELGKQPNGARGEMAFTWKNGGGHSIAWEVVNNKPVLFDTQTGKMFKDVETFEKYGQHIKEAGFTRLDNKKLNEDFLMRWAKNVK